MSTLTETSRKVNKTDRIPMSGTRDKLAVRGKKDGYVYRIVNDTPGRVQEAQLAGYEVVVGEDITFGHRHVDSASGKGGSVATTPVGGGTDGILMRIRKDWYEEDKKARHDAIDESEKQMRRNLNNKSEADYGKFDTEK